MNKDNIITFCKQIFLTIAAICCIVVTCFNLLLILDYFRPNQDKFLTSLGLKYPADLIVFIIILVIVTAVYLLFFCLEFRKKVKHRDYQNSLDEIASKDEQLKFYSHILDECSKNIKDDDLINSLEDIHISEGYVKYCKFCLRVLLRLARYRVRYNIGGKLLEFGVRTGNREAEIIALIDGIGWSQVKLSCPCDAIKNIQKGIALAKEFELYQLYCKGCRHLAGIYLKTDIDKAKFYKEEIKKELKNITDDEEKLKMEAYLAMVEGDIYIKDADGQTAIIRYKEAESLFGKIDESYLPKIWYKMGDYYRSINSDKSAVRLFIRGWILSSEYSKLDEEMRNCKALYDVSEERDLDLESICNEDNELKQFMKNYGVRVTDIKLRVKERKEILANKLADVKSPQRRDRRCNALLSDAQRQDRH